MAKAKIFISGVAGFLGSHLAERLLAKGFDVVGADDLSGGEIANVPAGTEFHQYDVRDIERNRQVLKGVNAVFHLAAAPYEGLSVFSPHHVVDSIVNATTALLSAAAEKDVRRFVFASSMSRYGEQSPPFVESLRPAPITPYGIAKVCAEQLTQNVCHVHGMEYSIFVPHNIIGPRQKFDDPFRNVAAIMINRMLQGLQPIIYGDGSQKRCFSYVSDCVQVVEKMVAGPAAVGEVVNIGPDEEFVTVLELAQTIAEILNFNLDPIFLDARPQEVAEANCSADKARRLFDYKTEYSLRSGLVEMVHWMKSKGPRPFQYHIPLEIRRRSTPRSWVERLI